jgi:hypothetical protein
LGHLDDDLAFGGLQALGAAAVTPAAALVGALVAAARQEGRHLVLDGSLQYELRAEPAELAEALAIADAALEQIVDGLFKQG